MRLKKITIILAIIMSLLALTSCSNKNIVAKVDGKPITTKEYTDAFNQTVSQIKSDPQYNKNIWNQDYNGKKFIDTVKGNVLDNLIMEKILIKQAQKDNIKVSDNDINTEYNKEKATDKTITKEKVKDYLMINKLADNYTKDVKVSDSDAQKYYNDNKNQFEVAKASHILLADQKTANDIYDKLMKGANFADLAKQYSLDTATKNNGGELGEFPRGAMLPEFEQAAFSMKNGEISKPVKTQAGYHIIKSEGVTIKPYNEVKDSIIQYLQNSKKNDAFLNKYNQLKKNVKIEKFPQNIKVTVE